MVQREDHITLARQCCELNRIRESGHAKARRKQQNWERPVRLGHRAVARDARFHFAVKNILPAPKELSLQSARDLWSRPASPGKYSAGVPDWAAGSNTNTP